MRSEFDTNDDLARALLNLQRDIAEAAEDDGGLKDCLEREAARWLEDYRGKWKNRRWGKKLFKQNLKELKAIIRELEKEGAKSDNVQDASEAMANSIQLEAGRLLGNLVRTAKLR